MSEWNIREALSPVPEEGDYVMRVESVGLHVPEDDSKYPSFLFKLKVISPEVPENMTEQSTFLTTNPKWLKFLGDTLANAEVLDIDGGHGLDLDDKPEMARTMDNLFGGKTFVYELKHGTYNGAKSANLRLVRPTSSW